MQANFTILLHYCDAILLPSPSHSCIMHLYNSLTNNLLKDLNGEQLPIKTKSQN